MPMSKLAAFEKANGLSVNVLGYKNEGETFPIHISKNQESNGGMHINLLLVQNESKGNVEDASSGNHYCLIQSISRLLSGKHKSAMFYCMRCLNPTYTAENLKEHERLC